jgi:hypothetical protein
LYLFVFVMQKQTQVRIREQVCDNFCALQDACDAGSQAGAATMPLTVLVVELSIARCCLE